MATAKRGAHTNRQSVACWLCLWLGALAALLGAHEVQADKFSEYLTRMFPHNDDVANSMSNYFYQLPGSRRANELMDKLVELSRDKTERSLHTREVHEGDDDHDDYEGASSNSTTRSRHDGSDDSDPTKVDPKFTNTMRYMLAWLGDRAGKHSRCAKCFPCKEYPKCADNCDKTEPSDSGKPHLMVDYKFYLKRLISEVDIRDDFIAVVKAIPNAHTGDDKPIAKRLLKKMGEDNRDLDARVTLHILLGHYFDKMQRLKCECKLCTLKPCDC